MLSGEIWRDVPSAPGILVSSEGRVMHVPHREPMPKGGTRPYGGQPTFGVWNKADARFIVVIDGKTHKVHRLVAEAFHGQPPFEGAVVMHLDEKRCEQSGIEPTLGDAEGESERRRLSRLLPRP